MYISYAGLAEYCYWSKGIWLWEKWSLHVVVVLFPPLAISRWKSRSIRSFICPTFIKDNHGKLGHSEVMLVLWPVMTSWKCIQMINLTKPHTFLKLYANRISIVSHIIKVVFHFTSRHFISYKYLYGTSH